MNVKHFLIVAIFAVLAIGAVSAADNATCENLTDSGANGINVTYAKQMWAENLTDISVDLPENATGDFMVKINDEVIYNQTITEKSFKVPVKLPKAQELYISVYPPIDFRTYRVSAFYNGVDLNLTSPLKVMKFSPDYNLLHFPEEILKNDKYFRLLAFPRSANGTVEFYIDDKLFNKTTARPTVYWRENPFSKLPLGKHTFRVIYHGDSYYRPYERTFNFTVQNVVITIPDVINIGHDDCISVNVAKNVKGNVKVYLDGRLIVNSNIEDDDYILSLEKYIRYTDREVKVTYTSKDFTRSKTKPVNMTYDFDVWCHGFRYGAENVLDVMLPDTLNNKLLKITINGKEYRFTRAENIVNNDLELDISNFPAGNYSMFLSYRGDDKFYPLNKTVNFTIDYYIHIPYSFHYKSNAEVTLKLPKDAKGDLVVYADGELFGSARFNNGIAKVKLGLLEIGRHNIVAVYNGSDYDVPSGTDMIFVSPKIDFNHQITVGEDEFITVEVPNSSTGHVVFIINDRQHKVLIRNGIAKYSLKSLKVGEYEISIDYYGDDGVEDLSNWIMLDVKKPKVKIITDKSSFRAINLKIKLSAHNGKKMAYKSAKIKFNGRTYKVKTDKNGIITFKKSMKLKSKKYAIKIIYKGATITKKLKIKPLILKASVGKKRLAVKVTINKKIKNRKVVIKANSKRYTVKTNKAGVAKISIEKSAFKKTKRVTLSGTYLKSTVKKTVMLSK